MKEAKLLVGIIMGSDSDLKIMSQAAEILESFDVPYEIRVVSAHRTPDIMQKYAKEASSRGIKVIIAGAGGSAHLPGMTASECLIPVIAVPIKSNENDHEALWSNIKMPPGVPLGTMPENGAKNAALYAVEILGLGDKKIQKMYKDFRDSMHLEVTKKDKLLLKNGWKKYLEDK